MLIIRIKSSDNFIWVSIKAKKFIYDTYQKVTNNFWPCSTQPFFETKHQCVMLGRYPL
jgi:hypothetical protein